MLWATNRRLQRQKLRRLVSQNVRKVLSKWINHWGQVNPRQRWLATALLNIEPRLRKVEGYRHLPRLREALRRELQIEKATTRNVA